MKSQPTSFSRREFIKICSSLGFTYTGVLSFLSSCANPFGIDDIGSPLSDEFHYFDNNLTNLHFYFVDAQFKGSGLILEKDKKSLMVVKVPQQHISEQLIRGTEFGNYKDKNTLSNISGFSYLVFKLLPNKDVSKPRKVSISGPETLLDWTNRELFELVVPEKSHFTEFGSKFDDFRKNSSFIIKRDKSNLEFLKTVCKQIFSKATDFPVTLLEIPEGLLTVPYKGVQKPGVKPPPPSTEKLGVTGEVKTVFSKPPVTKKQFVYDTAKGTVIRSVQEIWNTQMWFQQFERIEKTQEEKAIGPKYSPPLRPAAYFEGTSPDKPCKDSQGNSVRCECPPDTDGEIFLPAFIDKQELTYIASLGRQGTNNEGDEWNIETKGLTFTGLGAITKFHYKNFNPPNGTDLAEYEHHITLGRDEYIKVARLGVISVTGQRALHVKIGQRKIVSGVSYMEYKEYIEVIQKEINYFDSNLFKKGEPNQNEPGNYIHAKRDPVNPETILHGEKDFWTDSVIWEQNDKKYLPDKWETHYRRWPFKRIDSVTFVTAPIDSEKDVVPVDQACGACPSPKNPMAFWPVLEKDPTTDATLDFRGHDWNDKPISFSHTFLFIRKMLIDNIKKESGLTPCADNIYKNFVSQKRERTHIKFINSQIAFTRDYAPIGSTAEGKTGEEFENKSNIAKTDFVEYYFSLCSEMPANPPGITDISIFNQRVFPLYPQAKRAQLYVENIQGYANRPLPSIVEYNSEFVIYGFEGKKVIDGKTVTPIYNKARLIFNHTDAFRNANNKILELNEKGKWIESQVSKGYADIKRVFSGAGDAIGGLVNPDFDIQSIGLIKQSIAIGKDINKKLEDAEGVINKIEKFNPSDLFRQMPEVLNGISLLDVLQEVFPETEAPVNEIKNIAGDIKELSDEIVKSFVFRKVKEKLREVREKIDSYIREIEKLQGEIDKAKAELKILKDKLNLDYYFADLENLVESAITKYKIDFITYKDGLVAEIEKNANNANAVADRVVEYLATETLSKIEVLYPYWEKLRRAERLLNEIKAFELPDKKKLSAEAQNLIDNFIKEYITKVERYPLFDITKAAEKDALRAYVDLKQQIGVNSNAFYAKYKEYSKHISDEATARKDYLEKKIDLTKYSEARNKLAQASNDLRAFLEQADNVKNDALNLFESLKKIAKDADAEILNKFETEISTVAQTAYQAIEAFKITTLPHFLNLFEKANKDFEIIITRLKSTVLNSNTEDFISNIIKTCTPQDVNTPPAIISQIKASRKSLTDELKLNYDNRRADVNNLILLEQDYLKNYSQALADAFGKLSLPKGITELIDKIKIIEVGKLEGPKSLKQLEDELKKTIRTYEDLLKKSVLQETDGIVGAIKAEIEKLENDILNDPENQQLIKQFAEAKRIYNLLTSLTRKDIDYNWKTTSFKNADFGIVSFVSSENPKTSLTVDVKNTIHFQPNQFPPVVSKIESFAQNRLTNFGVGLLKAITVNFNEVSFTAGTNRSPKFDVKVRDVQFAGAFSFVQALEQCFKGLLGDNFRVDLQPTGVNISYLIEIPFLGAPSFGFRDIIFQVIFRLYFDGRPLELGAGIGTLENKTKLSVGIYTGFFYFSVLGNPKQGITTIEVSLEFGGYFGLSLGPLRGEVKLVVGLYYKKDPTGVYIEGYFLCEGRVKLWFVMITARFYMGVRSQGNYVEGRCTVTYEISLGRFFKKSFSATFYKKLAGATPGNGSGGGPSGFKALPPTQTPTGLPAASPTPSPTATLGPASPKPQDTNGQASVMSTPNENEEGSNKDYRNPVKRAALRLSLKDWDEFISSYTN